jgi:DNA-binding MarR family transcriptional regulator
MYDTRNLDAIVSALMDLTGCLNSPRQDDVLLREAGVALDRALFPLLVRLAAEERMAVARLAERVGRDASTVSRQLAKLEDLGLIKRPPAQEDMRVREAAITKAGARTVDAIGDARRKMLDAMLSDWSVEERRLFPKLVQRLADAMKTTQTDASAS